MYWWNVAKLAEDLREGQVTEKERFKYYIAFIVLLTVELELAPYLPETSNMVKFTQSAANLIITITGTILCYGANRAGDNADFIGRMICLSWPIGIKLLVLYVASAVVRIFFISDSDIAKFIWGTFFEICFYWMLYKYVKLVAQPKEALGTPI